MNSNKAQPRAPSAQDSTTPKQEKARPQSQRRDTGLPPLPPSRDSRLKRPIVAKRSGGPRTAEGRARSALNAIKHGGYVTEKGLALDFQATHSELISRLNPTGTVEEGVVHQLAIEIFRLTTLGKLEVERVQSAALFEVNLRELAQSLDYPWLDSHPHDLRDPPEPKVLRARLLGFLDAQLNSLRSQCASSPSQSDAQTIETLELACADLRARQSDDASQLYECADDEYAHEPAYLDELDRLMHVLASGHDLMSQGMGLPADVQPVVDYWLFRNQHRIQATRREMQVEQMILILTNENVRRARGHAMRHLDDCVRLLGLLQGKPVELGSVHARKRLRSP